MLETGQKAPAFTLESDAGKSVSLADYAGKTVILYFYPKDSTPGCTREAEAFRDAIPSLARSAMQVTRLLKNNLRPLTEPDAVRIYEAAY